MNSFYPTLYGRFANLQIEQNFSARLRYPSNDPSPSLKVGNKISECIVGIPRFQFKRNSISYGLFSLTNTEFGQVAAIKLCLGSACLLSVKAILSWIYRNNIEKWLSLKQDALRAQYTINVILDTIARKRIKKVEGIKVYNSLIVTADLLSASLLSPAIKDFSAMSQAALASSMLKVPMNVPRQIITTVEAFESYLANLSIDFDAIIETLKSRTSESENKDAVQISDHESGWEDVARIADNLYFVMTKISGNWHDVYLPYSHPLPNMRGSKKPISIFQSKVISENDFVKIRALAGFKESEENDEEWLQIYYELMKEEKRNEKMEEALQDAAKDLNFTAAKLPMADFVSYYNLHAELLPNIRRMIDRVRQVKNSLDDNPLQESGSLDMQLVIQSMATGVQRNDVFNRDENLSKDECWTILIDSSLSLSGSSRQIKAIAICLAESANQTLGQGNPWAMFTFSDEFYCIKNYDEPYDKLVKARIGGLKQRGLSYIPDALKAASNLARRHAKEKNFIILVSDGVPSGYIGIEREFANAVNLIARNGINIAAIGVGSSTIKKAIRTAKVVDEPIDLVNGFMDLYNDLAS
jgi:Mg-chelatase subunit ChlD